MKILLAIDGARHSDAAIELAARWKWPARSHIHVITVDPGVDPSFLVDGGGSAYDNIVKQLRTERVTRLNDAARELRANASQPRVTTALIEESSPQDAILNTARRWGADLVVVGSRGYGPIRRLFSSSVSLSLVRSAPCPVLVVRPEAIVRRQEHHRSASSASGPVASGSPRFPKSFALSRPLDRQPAGERRNVLPPPHRQR